MFKTIKEQKGFTLIELLITTGVISVASVGLYYSYQMAKDWYKTNNETKSLFTIFNEIENSTASVGKFEDINKDNLHKYSSDFHSEFNLFSVDTPIFTKVNFNYQDMNDRNCINFVSNLLSIDVSSFMITSKVNNNSIDKNNLNDIVYACNNDNNNEVTISLNKISNQYSIDTIVASVNTPPPPHDDVIVPYAPIPSVIPSVPNFIPPTLNLDNYGINGTAPVYPVVPPSGGPISVTTGGNSGGTVTPPTWTPPGYTPAPPATGTPVDDIDQDPLPPKPPAPPPPPPGVSPALPPTPIVEVPAGTAPAGQVGGVGTLKINIAWGGNEDVDFALWDPRGVGYGIYAAGDATGCRYNACWDLDNKGQINAPGDVYSRQENVYYPSNPPLGRYSISMYRFRGRPVNNARISVTAVIGGVGLNQSVYMPAGFNSFSIRTPYPVKVILDLTETYFLLYLL